MVRVLIVVAVLATLQACSTFTQPKANPVIEDRITDAGWGKLKIGVLATTPERRVMVVQMPDNRFCAEPPPDVADSVSAALSAVAQASAQGKVSDAQIGFAQTLATSVKQLFQRSQGVQLYRDGSFMLCNAYLNGAITQPEFVARHARLLEVAKELIAAEIPKLHEAKPIPDTKAPALPPPAKIPPLPKSGKKGEPDQDEPAGGAPGGQADGTD